MGICKKNMEEFLKSYMEDFIIETLKKEKKKNNLRDLWKTFGKESVEDFLGDEVYERFS